MSVLPADLLPYAEVIAALGPVCRCSGRYAYLRCPAHEDGTPSLSAWVREPGGPLLLGCWSGCHKQDILAAAGLKWGDLFPADEQRKECRRVSRIVATYDYRAADGELLYQTVRLDPKDFRQRRPDGNGGWHWNLNGVVRVLYRLPELRAADAERTVFVVEGEKDADALHAVGALATTAPCGASAPWLDSYSDELHGRHVVIIPDCDDAGVTHAAAVVGSLVIRGAASIRVSCVPAKDVSEWFWLLRDEGVREPGEYRRRLRDCVRTTALWRQGS